MFRFHIHSPSNWLIGIQRYQTELEDNQKYEAFSIGLLIISIEYIWDSDIEDEDFATY